MNDQTGTPKPLKIVGLLAENIKRLAAIEIRPDGTLVEITGKNGAGKSSVLDSITWAIEGARHIQAKPIREGWNEAKIRLDLGEIEVTRRFRNVPDGDDSSRVTTDLEIRLADGAPVRRPQELLNSLFGALALDPIEFLNMKADERFETLKRFVPDVDFERYALDHAKDFEERRDWNRRAKDYDAQARACPADMGATGEPIDEAALVDKLQDTNNRRMNRERAQAAIDRAREDCRRMCADAEGMRQQADELIKQAEAQEAMAIREAEAADVQEARLNAAPPLPDIQEIRRELDEAKTHNAKLVGRGERLRLFKQAEEARKRSEDLTRRMDERELEKRNKIEAAAMPVPGLGFEGSVVTLGGHPFEQASMAEQIRASLHLAMAQNPRLRVVLIREASLIDSDGMELIRQIAETRGFQVWAERVQPSGTGPSILIEDGTVK